MTQTQRESSSVQTTVLTVAGMTCGACVRHVARALDGMIGVVHVEVDLERDEARVEHMPGWVDAAGLIAAIGDAGYQARVSAGDAAGVEADSTVSVSEGCGSSCCCQS